MVIIKQIEEINNTYQQSAPIQQLPQQIQPLVQNQNLLINSPTGIVEFDDIIGGGFPKGSIILLAGSSGSGKTIFSFKWLFEGVKNNENGIYITLTEPLFKSLKNLESMSFYDRNAIEQEKVKIIDIEDICEKEKFDQEKIIDFIEENVKQTNAKRLCIDSVTAIAYNLDDKAKIRKFIFELGKILSTLGCTTILTSEVGDEKKFSVYEVEEFISDVILRLDQIKERDELQRRMQIIKMRGRSYKADDIDFKISECGIIVFPRIRPILKYPSTGKRISTGNTTLDEMMFGGVFEGSSALIVGSTGTGKSVLCIQFIIDGLRKGEACFYVGFEESRDQLIRNTKSFGWDMEEYEKKGLLTLRCVYPIDKFLEEHLTDIKNIIESKKIKRCVIDSLSSISNSFSNDSFTSFAKRLNGYLKTQNVTCFFTAATASLIGTTELTESHISTIIDNIIMLRYVEVGGELKSVINVVKERGSNHSKVLKLYDITSRGIVISQSLVGYEGIMTGSSRKVSETTEEKIETVFKKFIGPMATSVFSDLKSKGLTKESVLSYIDDLTAHDILKKEDAEEFKKDIIIIMDTSESKK
jgi:circadian clock protein KaiC